MDTCAQLAAILAQMGPGQAITWLKEQMDGLFARPLAAFNAMLRERQLGTIVAPSSK